MSFSIGEHTIRGLRVSDMAGDYAAWNYFMSLETAENKKFVQKFRNRYGPQRVLTDPMESAYLGVKLWAQAVREAESFDVKKFRRAMRNQRIQGPSGEVRIDPTTQHSFKTPYIGQIQPNGQFRIVSSAKKPVAPMPYPTTRTTQQWHEFLIDLYNGWGKRWSAANSR